MRVVLVGPVYPYRGGIAQHTTQLYQALREHDHSVKIISFRRQYPGWLYPGGSDRDPSQEPMKTAAEYLLDPLLPWTWRGALNKIINFSPDIVIFQWWTTFWAIPYARLSKALRHNNILVSYLIHNVIPHEERVYDRFLAQLALKVGKIFIVQNPNEKERLLDLLPSVKVVIHPLPGYKRFSPNRKSKTEARQILALPEDQDILLFFGIVRAYKGLNCLLEALARVREQGRSPLLIIAGEFWENIQTYNQQVETLGLADIVRIEDRYLPDEEADLYLSACDILVAPYIAGTQSAAASIAIGYDLPIILTERIAAGIPTDYQDSISIVPPGDIEALARSISDLLIRLEGGIEPPPILAENWDSLVLTLENISRMTIE